MQVIQSIQNRTCPSGRQVYEIRGERVMPARLCYSGGLGFDLAALYETETRIFNQAVKRNIKRFPKDFMFQLTSVEWTNLKSQFVTSSTKNTVSQTNTTSIQITNISNWGGTRKLPYAFTEQGVAMLSGILNSDRAIQMPARPELRSGRNIAIMRAFVEVRKILLQQSDIKEQLKELKDRVSGHDMQLSQTCPSGRRVYDALENLLNEKAAERKWENRERIGFKTKK